MRPTIQLTAFFFTLLVFDLSQYLFVTKWLSIGKPHVPKLIESAAELHATFPKIEILECSLTIEESQKSKSQENK